MDDPVVAADGHTYERRAITKWFEASKDATPISPLTGQPLDSKALLPNHTLKKAIAEAVAKDPKLREEMGESSELDLVFAKVEMLSEKPLPPPASAAATQPYTFSGGGNVTLVAQNTSSDDLIQFSDAPAAAPATGQIVQQRPEQSVILSCSRQSLQTVDGQICVWRRDFADQDWYQVQVCSTRTGAAQPLQKKKGLAQKASTSDAEYVYASRETASMSSMPSRLASFPSRAMASSASSPASVSLTAPSSPSPAVMGSKAADCSIICLDEIRRTAEGIEFIAGSRDYTLGVWRLDRDSCELTRVSTGSTLHGHSDRVHCVTVVRPWSMLEGVSAAVEADTVVSGSRDKTLRVWHRAVDGQSGGGVGRPEQEWECRAVLEGHRDFVNCVANQEGSLVSGGEDWDLILWDAERADAGPVKTFSGHSLPVRCCAWASTGSPPLLASGGDDETVCIWDVRAKYGNRIARLDTGSQVLTCCWGQGATWLAAGGGPPTDSFSASSSNAGGWVRVWDPRTWKPIGDCSFAKASDRDSEGDVKFDRQAHANQTTAIAPLTLANGSIGLLSGGDDKALRLWKLPESAGGINSPVLVTKLSPDHRLAVDCLRVVVL